MSFNSATAVMPWKLRRTSIMTKLDMALQFGHGCDAVETRQRAQSKSSTARLQFGHGCDAVETMAWASPLMATITRLQFGHVCDAVETVDARSRHAGATVASIRPRL